VKGALGVKVIMVIGAPGSGKSTFVEKTREPGDLVIDLDGIQSELSGKPLYLNHGHEVLERAIQERNRRIEALQCEFQPGKTLWFVISGSITYDRMTWRRILSPSKTYVMQCTLTECIQRIQNRKSETDAEQIQAAERWFKNYEPFPDETIVYTGDS
jgi:shikimate kinase